MTTARTTSRGQLAVPGAVRDALGIGPGDRLEFVPTRMDNSP